MERIRREGNRRRRTFKNRFSENSIKNVFYIVTKQNVYSVVHVNDAKISGWLTQRDLSFVYSSASDSLSTNISSSKSRNPHIAVYITEIPYYTTLNTIFYV